MASKKIHIFEGKRILEKETTYRRGIRFVISLYTFIAYDIMLVIYYIITGLAKCVYLLIVVFFYSNLNYKNKYRIIFSTTWFFLCCIVYKTTP